MKLIERDDLTAESLLANLDNERLAADCHQLINIMSAISGHSPKAWGDSIVGFDKYRYRHDSGRKGEAGILGFAPRSGKLAVYLVDGTSRYQAELVQIGKHKTSKVYLYINKLSDIDIEILSSILEKSYQYIKSRDQSMRHAE